MAVSISTRSQGIDGEDLIAGGQQGADQQPAVSLDADHNRGRLLGVLGDEGVQLTDALKPLVNSSLGQHLPALVDQADVVVGFRPIDSDKDHWHLLAPTHQRRAKESPDELIEQCSRHNIPPVVFSPRLSMGAPSRHRALTLC